MKIGIIIHSFTGNTLSVAQKIKESLHNDGHDVTLEKVTAINENPSDNKNILLDNKPDLAAYDLLIFGAPVRAFCLSPVMKLYLNQFGTINRRVFCFVTQQLPFKWMGGHTAIMQFKNALKVKRCKVLKTGIISSSDKKRENDINKVIESFKI